MRSLRENPPRLLENVSVGVVEWRASRISDPVKRLRYLREKQAVPRSGHRYIRTARVLAVAAVLLLIPFHSAPTSLATQQPAVTKAPANPKNPSSVWQVSTTPQQETYSNGLRIERVFEAAGGPAMTYPVWDENLTSQTNAPQPVGIVFHTTESLIAPFEAQRNKQLQRIAEELLHFIRNRRSYHFVIDRFGRVYRIVPENERANHAGNSIWASANDVYVNLNSSFIGISFEAQTDGGAGHNTANEAQIHSARILTEMLRAKYKIPADNCVTHAQVSVNPHNMGIGWHTDWAANFPFEQLGLADNYQLPIASLYTLGFDYDTTFVKNTGARLWNGLMLAEQRLRADATSRGITAAQYQSTLRQKYRRLFAKSQPAEQTTEEEN